MSLSQEGSCTSGGPEGRWTIEVGASVGAIGRDGAPPGEVRAVERDRGDGDALAVWQAGQHLAGRARDAAPAEAPELPLASDAIGHRHEGDVLQGARGREALRRPAVPAPHGALVVIGDPVGAVDDEVGDEVARRRAFRKHRELGPRPCGRVGEVVDLLQIGSHLARDAVHLHDGDAKIHYAAPGSDPIAARRTSCSFASPPVNSRTAAPSRMTRTRWLSASTSFSSEEMRTMATP